MFASVNVCGLTASQLKLQGKGKKKKKSFEPIDISHSNQGNVLKYMTGGSGCCSIAELSWGRLLG